MSEETRSPTISQQSDKKPTPERREFLTKSAVLLTALGVAVGATDADAAETGTTSGTKPAKANGRAQGQALKAVLAQAVKTGDIRGAVRDKGAALPPAAKNTLFQLNKADLVAIQNLEEKLGALQGQLAADNVGGNGM